MGESLRGETASGESLYNELVAAHPTYPMGTVVRVTNLNQRTAELRIIDRSATAQNQKESVIIDVSEAEKLGFDKKKVACVHRSV